MGGNGIPYSEANSCKQREQERPTGKTWAGARGMEPHTDHELIEYTGRNKDLSLSSVFKASDL